MTQDLIRYDILAQDALRGVIKTVLKGALQDGLPGEHHFYITFATGAQGVRLSKRMREQYPEEMTVVLQHQYWDLEVTEHGFSVGLAFNGIPEKLTVPFAAITRFFDPSVQFGLEFEVDTSDATDAKDEAADKAKEPVKAEALAETTEPAEATEPEKPDADAGEEAPDSADVVSLDAFRKNK